jgi:dTDP-4-dehydrorhamnose 3,5-epimerase
VPLEGSLFVGLHDLRDGSATAGETQTVALDAGEPAALLIPPGVAHGFQALEDAALLYLVTEPYDGTDEEGFRFDDPGAGVPWPLADPVLSERDSAAPTLEEFRAHWSFP